MNLPKARAAVFRSTKDVQAWVTERIEAGKDGVTALRLALSEGKLDAASSPHATTWLARHDAKAVAGDRTEEKGLRRREVSAARWSAIWAGLSMLAAVASAAFAGWPFVKDKLAPPTAVAAPAEQRSAPPPPGASTTAPPR